MIHPTIHLNGTSRNELLEQWNDAYVALSDAYKALCNAAPNGRDYYPQGSDAIDAAIIDHCLRLKAIQSIQMDLEILVEKALE